MPYKIDNRLIDVTFPVKSISVNKNAIVYTDKQGKNKETFPHRNEALNFMKWLVNSQV